MSNKQKTKTRGFNLSFLVNLTLLLLFFGLGIAIYIFIMKELESQKLQEYSFRIEKVSEDILKENILPTDSTKRPSAQSLFRFG